MTPKASRGYPVPPYPKPVTVSVANIMFTGTRTDYNPLYDRERELKIEPPQWQKDPRKDEPISYVRKKRATLKLDITGSPDKLRVPVWVKVTPKAELLKKTVTEDGKEELVPDPGSTSIAFKPQSEPIRVTKWDDPDYEQLSFTTNPLPDEVRLNQLKITWNFKYGYTKNGPWFDAGKERTAHEIYITYARPYYGFPMSYRPWKQVLRTACSYAHGAKTTIKASSLVTTGIYDSLEFKYDGTDSHSEFDNSQIRLWDMIGDGWVDCMDGSNYYTILMRWLGINANQIKINEDPRRDQGFYYTTLRPISASDNHTVGWLVRNRTKRGSNWWNFHQVGILGDEQHGTLGSHIYDPIIKINEIDPTVPTNMIRDDYKRALFDPVPYRDPKNPKMDRVGKFPWHVAALVCKVI